MLTRRPTSAADTLHFQLAALRQAVRSLTELRGSRAEAERLALDFVGEVFFAWWAALLRADGTAYRVRATRSLRGDTFGESVPTREVVAWAPLRAGLPSATLPGNTLPADLAVICSVGGEPVAAPGHSLLVLGTRVSGRGYDTDDLALLETLADATALAARNADLLDRLRAEATTDGLTGSANRRAFDERLNTEFARAERHHRTFAVVLLDLDHFKRINDSCGHAAGDATLRRLGALLRRGSRSTDLSCRFGGEEFAMLLPETGLVAGLAIAERLRVAVAAEFALPGPDGTPGGITASFGVAAWTPDRPRSPGELLRAADRALYQAKQRGRNRVEAELLPVYQSPAVAGAPDQTR